jgi:hypothetical protein
LWCRKLVCRGEQFDQFRRRRRVDVVVDPRLDLDAQFS